VELPCNKSSEAQSHDDSASVDNDTENSSVHEPSHKNQPEKDSIESTLPLVLAEPILFQDITDKDLRRIAFKLFKRLNYDPWDYCNKYNDADVLQFLSEHPQTAMVMYDFEFFSGHIFPLSVLCALGASCKTIEQAYQAYEPAIDECDVWIGSPLHYACSYKAKPAVVKLLISMQPSMLEKTNQFGRMPLHMACLFKASSKTISVLLHKYPSAVDVAEKDGYTPLHLACENGANADVVKMLIDCNPDVCLRETSKECSTPLHLACAFHANSAVVKILLDACSEALDRLDASGLSPLHVAIKHQASVEVIEELVQSNPEIIHVPADDGHSAFSLAQQNNSSRKVLQLLKV